MLLPSDSGYAAAGHLYNSVYAQQAAAIAQCQSAGDVQRCLSFARGSGVQVAARSGGHSYAAYSSCPGLVIDVTNLDGCPSGAGGLATVGAGTVLIDVYSQLSAQGRLLPGGSCPTVGIAGLTLGGGVGVFGRAYGLTCDQLQTVEIVTADGALHRCGPDNDEDLYWACRGGGGGQLRRRDLLRVRHPSHSRGDHPLHARVALGRGRRRARRLAPLDPLRAR